MILEWKLFTLVKIYLGISFNWRWEFFRFYKDRYNTIYKEIAKNFCSMKISITTIKLYLIEYLEYFLSHKNKNDKEWSVI